MQHFNSGMSVEHSFQLSTETPETDYFPYDRPTSTVVDEKDHDAYDRHKPGPGVITEIYL